MADDAEPVVVRRRPKQGQADALIREHEEQQARLVAQISACTQFAVGVAEKASHKAEDCVAVAAGFHAGGDLVVLLDGHHGRGTAQFVAQTLPTTVAEILSTQPPSAEALCAAFARCNDRAKTEGTKGGCAGAVVFSFDHRLFCANVGDVRVVVAHSDASVSRWSRDHRAADPAETARIESLGGFVQNGRLMGQLEVARGFGDFNFQPFVSCEPFVPDPLELTGKLVDFVIMACDGLWDVCDDARAAEVVRGILGSGADGSGARALAAKRAADLLVSLAVAEGSKDDITVAVLMF